MRTNLLLSIFLFVTPRAFAQQQASHWYFGDKVGVHFQACEATTRTVGSQYSNEGVAAISDADGNLRFYTNGLTFWDDQHQVMEGGRLSPHWTVGFQYDYTTTTQAALIVPQPGQTDRYWTFLTSPRSGHISDGRFCYVSVGAEDNPTGKLKVESTPICLRDSVTERMTGVQHANGQDFWVIVQAYRSADILAYRVSDQGIVTQPIISPTGRAFRYMATAENNTAFMKVSPDGRRLAYVYWETDGSTAQFDNTIVVMDFDAATGQASNPTFIDQKLTGETYYGLAFSSDGNKLYVSSEKKLLQFDLSQADLAASQVTLYSFGNNARSIEGRHALQLAPDGRIYMTHRGRLGAILYPNLAGLRASVVPYFTSFGTGGRALVGLPNFVQSYLLNPFPARCPIRLHTLTDCAVDSSYVSVLTDTPDRIASVQWQVPPGSVAHDFTVTVPLSTEALLTVVADITFTNGRDTTLQVLLNENLVYRLPSDTAICLGDTLWVTPPAAMDYVWEADYTEYQPEQVEDEQGLIPITQGGSYALAFTADGCYRRERLRVTINNPPSPELGEDIVVCNDNRLPVYLYPFRWRAYEFERLTDYVWSDGSRGEYLEVTKSGTYWFRAENRCGVSTDTIHVFVGIDLALELGEDQLLCEGETLTLRADLPGTYRWSTGDNTPEFTVSKPGTYWVEVENACGYYRDSITIATPQEILLSLPDTLTICPGEEAYLRADGRFQQYQWSSGEQDSTIQITRGGYYEVTVQDLCRTQRAGTWVNLLTPEAGFIPNVFTPNDDGYNDMFWLDEHLVGSHVQVHNRWGKVIFKSLSYHNDWGGGGLPAGVYFYTIQHPCLAEPLRGPITIQRIQ